MRATNITYDRHPCSNQCVKIKTQSINLSVLGTHEIYPKSKRREKKTKIFTHFAYEKKHGDNVRFLARKSKNKIIIYWFILSLRPRPHLRNLHTHKNYDGLSFPLISSLAISYIRSFGFARHYSHFP